MITIDIYSKLNDSEVLIEIITKDIVYLAKKVAYIYDFKKNEVVAGDLEILENIEYAINTNIVEEFKKLTKIFK